jgi:two-component sensor histidine kinase
LRDDRHRSGRKTLAQRAKSGDLEVKRQATWGMSGKIMEVGPHGDRLTPRKSFEEWKQTVGGHCRPWTEDERQCAEHLRITMLEVILRLTENTNKDLDNAAKRQEVLIAELNHRVRNILNLIRSLVNQSRPQFGTIEEYAEILGSRVEALARAHDQLTIGDWSPTPIRQLINVEASSWLKDDSERVSVEGVYAIIQPRALTTLALVLHELMTNSSKYGALSVATGKVVIQLVRCDDDALEMIWTEIGGPPVKQPQRRGFGSTLIERSIPHELGGNAEVFYYPTGLKASFLLPANCIESFPDIPVKLPDTTSATTNLSSAASLPGSALLVEDNVLIAIETEDVLAKAGVKKIFVVSNVAEALQVLKENEVGFAIVDVNLGTETSEPVAEQLKKRNIPFVLATGYGESLSEYPAYHNVPTLKKPYSRANLFHTLNGIFET